ncbi:hypothetical protein EXW58_27430 (plasmid) [Bacillus mycoides]|nr:hypothetical protein EXW58_27430 [Bacillus mycoides]
MVIYLLNNGVPPAFWKKSTLRACKILYSFSANPVTNENPKTHTRIGMYKKMNSVIAKKKGILSESKDSPFSLLPIIGRYVNMK